MEDIGIYMPIWYILGIFYGHCVHRLVAWYIFPVLVCCSKKNLATLNSTQVRA
jgi:hypothetical protein